MEAHAGTELADPQRSYAVLIGSARYGHASLDDLPAVANNLARLAELLADTTIWGLPRRHCVLIPEPASREEVLDAIHDAAGRADDTLMVYFAGHGLAHPDVNGLLLALPGTDPERTYTALDFDAVRGEVLGTRRDVNRVVILDCCYGGRAFAGGMGGVGTAVQMAEQTRIAGSYLLTASSATRQAQSPPGETYTAFTGELIRLLENGLPGAGELIEATHVYEHLYGELRSKGRPLPQQRLSNTGRALVFARNRHLAGTAPAPGGGGRRAADQFTRPDAPAGSVGPVGPAGPAWTPRELVREAARLRSASVSAGGGGGGSAGAGGSTDVGAGGDGGAGAGGNGGAGSGSRSGAAVVGDAAADAVLREWATRRPVQEVATLAVLLDAEQDRRGSDVVDAALAGRGPQAVAGYLDALHALADEPAAADRVLHQAAGQSVDIVAATYKALRSAGRTAEADRLLSLRTDRLRSTDDVLEVTGALWSADLEAEADRVLTAAVADSPEESGRLADALLSIGRQDRAFALYLRFQEAVVRRPLPALVQLLKGMHDAGRDDDATTVLERWIAGTLPPTAPLAPSARQAVTGLCAELRSSGLGPYASTVLGRAASTLPPADTLALAEALYRQGHGEDSVLLLSTATAAGPAEAVVDFMAGLREMGRPMDANALLDEAGRLPAPEVARLLERLETGGSTRDRDRLLTVIAGRPAPARLALLREPFLADGRHDAVFTPLGTLSDPAFTEVLEQLRADGSPQDLVTLFACGARVGAGHLTAWLARMERARIPEALVLRAYMRDRGVPAGGRVPAFGKGDLRAVADRVRSSSGLALTLAALQVLGQDEAVAYLARRAAASWLNSGQRLELTVSLCRRDLGGAARAVIKGGGWDDIGHLVETVTGLHAAGFPDDAAYALRCYAVRLGGGRAKKLAASLGLEPPPSTSYFPMLRRRGLAPAPD